MKVIIDTNLWISFLIGRQTQFVRLLLTDMAVSQNNSSFFTLNF